MSDKNEKARTRLKAGTIAAAVEIINDIETDTAIPPLLPQTGGDAATSNTPAEEAIKRSEVGSWRKVVYLVIGAGKRGKTVIVRYFLEKAHENGRAMIAIDLEQVGRGLRHSHPECRYPNYEIANGSDLASYFYDELLKVIGTDGSVIVDSQGNDERLIQLFAMSELVDILRHHGIRLIVVAVTGGGSDDLVVMQSLAKSCVEIKPDAFVPIYAERLLPSHRQSKEDAEEQFLEIEGVAHWINGEHFHPIWMPTCHLVGKLDHCEITYREAASSKKAFDPGRNPLKYFERSILKKWLNDVDSRFSGLVPYEEEHG